MSKKLQKIENQILKTLSKKKDKQMTELDSGAVHQLGYKFVNFLDRDTVDSISTEYSLLEKEREFELQRISRLWYKQTWFQILITSITSIITTVAATWFITKYIS
jgi:hypothetical protein